MKFRKRREFIGPVVAARPLNSVMSLWHFAEVAAHFNESDVALRLPGEPRQLAVTERVEEFEVVEVAVAVGDDGVVHV
jgi:hypothetical protein